MPKVKDTGQPEGRSPTDFQAGFIEKFLEPESPRCHRLIGPVGMGKQFMTVHLASRMLAEGARRLLILSPAALVSSWHLQLAETLIDREAMAIDRRQFLELQSEAMEEGSPWPEGAIVMSVDTAKRRDVAESLAETPWDLVVVDEAHGMLGQRGRLLEELVSSDVVARLLLLTATVPSEEQDCQVSSVFTTNWADDVARWMASHRPDGVGIELRTVRYTPGADELAFLNALDGFLQYLPSTPSAELARHMVLRSAASCIFNLERTLLRRRRDLELRDKLASKVEQVVDALGGVGPLIEQSEHDDIWESIPDCANKIGELLHLLDNVTTDAKLMALRALLDELLSQKSDGRIAIVSSFAGTAEYVLASVRETDVSAFLVNGTISTQEQEEAIRSFRDEGQILVATDATLMGINLNFTDAIVHYDLPFQARQFEARQGRYAHLGRTKPCTVCAFRDESRAIPLETELLERYGWTL
jgi:ERCC4-related helicase